MVDNPKPMGPLRTLNETVITFTGTLRTLFEGPQTLNP